MVWCPWGLLGRSGDPVGPILGFGSHPGIELKKGVGEPFILRPLGEHFGSLLALLGDNLWYLFGVRCRKARKCDF